MGRTFCQLYEQSGKFNDVVGELVVVVCVCYLLLVNILLYGCHTLVVGRCQSDIMLVLANI